EMRIANKKLAIVEVKSQSEVNAEQLGRYRRFLEGSRAGSTALVLLTRYPAAVAESGARPDAFVRWYQVAEWLQQERHRYAFQAVSAFLVDQFLAFLTARNMTMGQVTW